MALMINNNNPDNCAPLTSQTAGLPQNTKKISEVLPIALSALYLKRVKSGYGNTEINQMTSYAVHT